MRSANVIHDERGVATVIVLLSIPLWLLFGAFVINLGRWWVVDRHMQTQADASALAAGVELGREILFCDGERVEYRARQYGGIETAVGSEAPAKYNGPELVKTAASTYDPNFRFNSATYADGWGDSDPDAASFEGKSACQSGTADVKLTTTEVPWLLRAIDVAPNIHAHARVQLMRARAPLDIVPFGVETSDPKRVYAELVDLATGDTVPVYKGGTPVPGFDLTKDGIENGFVSWASSGQYTLQSSAPGRIGVRIRISDASGTVECGTFAVRCYGRGTVGGQANSLDTIRVYQEPSAYGVSLGPVLVAPSAAADACDPALQEVGTFSTTCKQMSVTANLAGLDSADKIVVKANDATLTRDGANWSGDVPITLGSGPNEITITWSAKGGSITTGDPDKPWVCTETSPCAGTFTNVHRAFAADIETEDDDIDNAGVLRHLTTIVGVGPYAAANNVPESSCSPASPCPLSVEAALTLSVSLAKPSDPPIPLRISESGSLTLLLDCDPDETSAAVEIAVGCGSARYIENDGLVDCKNKYLNVNQLFADTAASPWPCIGSEQGNRVPMVPQGLNARILCPADPLACLKGKDPECTSKNNWPNVLPGDPRIIPTFLIPLGSEAQSGSTVYPILGFAAFYIVGWSGSPCTGDDNVIPEQNEKDKASVFGHWIKYVAPNETGDANAKCDLASLEICTPVLVK